MHERESHKAVADLFSMDPVSSATCARKVAEDAQPEGECPTAFMARSKEVPAIRSMRFTGEVMDPAEIRTLPAAPGVYVFRDQWGQPLYVGKARDLRCRVGSYFRSSARHNRRIELLIERTVRIEIIPLASENEALIREARLIKEWHPRFNIRLRDDKSFPMLRVSTRGKRPGATLVRKRAEDGASYFGPCTRTGETRAALDVLRRVYTIDVTTLNPRTAAARKQLRGRILRMARDLRGWLVGDQPRGRRRLERALAVAARREDYVRAAALQQSVCALDALAQQSRGEE